jgi:penicillin-binding protein 1C
VRQQPEDKGDKTFHRLRTMSVVAFFAILLPWLSFEILDRALPPNLSRYHDVSFEVTDQNSDPLRLYLSTDDYYRLKTSVSDIDPRYIAMLIAFEDKRFRQHDGVDVYALTRALGQMARNGKVVSGASTLTMQVARLLEPRPRTLRSKGIEIFRAIQLERRLNKSEILSIYLTLAPFGGNVEGVRAASLHYFGQKPSHLTLGEAALLVALPQAPTRLRPDRHGLKAEAARNKVLDRVGAGLAKDPQELVLAAHEPLGFEATPFPFVAPHLSDHLKRTNKSETIVATHIDRGLQQQLENLARSAGEAAGERASVAMLVVESKSRKTLAYVGASNFSDFARDGQVDMVRAIRSPGSTLKPLIYGLAFERGIAHPATLVNDVPTNFYDYAPTNFMDRHYGEITLTEALRMSLNVPAVAVLRELGPVSVTERLRRAGMRLEFGGAESRSPGLALALGGVGTTLEDLVKAYAALGDDGLVRDLEYTHKSTLPNDIQPLMNATTRWYVAEILKGLRPPRGMLPDRYRERAQGIAWKTGTSWGFRDAWAVGNTGRHTIGVWVGRPDGTPSPGHFGANTAAPLLFQIVDQLGDERPPRSVAPSPSIMLFPNDLPPGQRYLGQKDIRIGMNTRMPPPRILFPLKDTVLSVPKGNHGILLEAEGGQRPYTWIVNGRPLPSKNWKRRTEWNPDGPGFSSIVLIDGDGRRVSTRVQLED